MRSRIVIPDSMPTLSRGRHRSAARGACFMEFASYLAGERWSDHPNCTDPTLSLLARLVNDLTTDATRAEFAIEVPRVVGLRGDDARLALNVAVRAASAALPIASVDRQRALAVGIVAIEDRLAQPGALDPQVRGALEAALLSAPDAESWARHYLATAWFTPRRHDADVLDRMVSLSAIGIADACVLDADAQLAMLLRCAIDDVERILNVETRDRNGASRASAAESPFVATPAVTPAPRVEVSPLQPV